MTYTELTKTREALCAAVEGIPVHISKLPSPNDTFVEVHMHDASSGPIIDSVELDGTCWKIGGIVEREPYKATYSMDDVSNPVLEDVCLYLSAKPKPNEEFTINLGRYNITRRETIGYYLFEATIGKKISN